MPAPHSATRRTGRGGAYVSISGTDSAAPPNAHQVDGVVLSGAPFLKLTLEEAEGLFLSPEVCDPPAGSDAAIWGRGGTSSPGVERTLVRDPARIGLRQFLTPAEGSGYWDHFRPLDHVILSIMDANYRHTTRVDVHGEAAFKLRLLLSGRLLAENGKSPLDGPMAILTLCPRGSNSGYYLAGGYDTRQIVLSCRCNALTHTLGLETEEIPTVLRGLAAEESSMGSSLRIDINAKVFQAAMAVVTSRFEYSGTFRRNILEAKCREILCSVLGDLRHREIERWAGAELTSRDLNRVLEARDYLVNHFRSPPSIPLLARRVGVSQTKLKANFRRVTGMTIYEFVQEQRMKRASELLLSGDHYVAQVAHAVGFAHAANFTSAFKKFYGFLPRALRSRARP